MHVEDELASQTVEGKVLTAAWLKWRERDLLPHRRVMELKDIAKILPRVMLLEAVSRTEIIFRLAGTYSFETTGIDLTGMNYIDMAGPDAREARAERIWLMVQQPCGCRALLVFNTERKARVVAETIMLPVRADQDDRPMQFISVIAPIDLETQALIRVSNVSIAGLKNLSNEFDFLDIGAGTPAHVPE